MKIGNGHQVSDASRILLYHGRNPPGSDTISSSNDAWVKARALYIFQNMATCSIAKFLI